MKTILIAGGSGFLGAALCNALIKQGHRITVISRNPERVATELAVTAISLATLTPTDHFDIVINLTGSGIADQRWSDDRKKTLLDSRLKTTQALIDWMHQTTQKPTQFFSGSAIGWYGAQGEQTLTEHSSPHDEFVYQLCAAWEQCAEQAMSLGIPTVLLRTGVVLDPAGGMLAKVLLPFKLCLGGRLGDGQQWMSWISRKDWVAAVLFLIEQPALTGPINLCSPHPVRNQIFTQNLAQALHRPAVFPMPAFVLRFLLGEMSGLLLDSQRVLPSRLDELGFVFQHATLPQAFEHLLDQH
jgi:uncharacterized protein (TIGR01777 family)